MKKFWKNNRYFEISLYAIFVVIISILFYRVSSNTDNIAPSIMTFVRGVIAVIAPILYGLLIAYLFNPIMDFFEHYLLMWIRPKTKNKQKAIRNLSILIVYICVIGTVVLMFRYLIPQILDNLRELANMIPTYIQELDNLLSNVQDTVNSSLSTSPYQLDTSNIFEVLDPEKLLNMNAINNLVTSFMSQAVTIASSFFNWIMGLVIAFYVLAQKETFSYSAKRLIYTMFNRPLADKIIGIFKEGHETFIQFFIGKFIDSFIIGGIALIALSIMGNPYAVLLALIIGVLNMIPYFGPILGAIPAVGITLFEGLGPAVAVLIFVIILQQFDGLVLGPKILGNSIGLSPFWIISGILIGGALWGPLGMFFASPILAVILNNINRHIDYKLEHRDIVVTETDKPLPPRTKPQSPAKWLQSKNNKKGK